MTSTLITPLGADSGFELRDMLDRIQPDASRQFTEADAAMLRDRFVELDGLIAGMNSLGIYQAPRLPARNGKD